MLALLLPGTGYSLPVVLWHGVNDNAASLEPVVKRLQSAIPGVYIHNLMIGPDNDIDKLNSVFMDPHKQLDYACSVLQSDPELKDGFHALGFSQGGLLMRTLLQTCSNLTVGEFISFGGPQAGVFGLPDCPPLDTVCEKVKILLDFGAYTPLVQGLIAQAQYWRDPFNDPLFRSKSRFLAGMNQLAHFNPVYRSNLLKASNVTLVRFTQDATVIPYASEWFGFFKPGQDKDVYSLQESKELWAEDRLGLNEMWEQNRLHFLSIYDDHLRIPNEFWENEVYPRLRN
eukprot:sb/3467779/